MGGSSARRARMHRGVAADVARQPRRAAQSPRRTAPPDVRGIRRLLRPPAVPRRRDSRPPRTERRRRAGDASSGRPRSVSAATCGPRRTGLDARCRPPGPSSADGRGRPASSRGPRPRPPPDPGRHVMPVPVDHAVDQPADRRRDHGDAAAIASSGTMPNGSYQGAQTTTSAERSTAGQLPARLTCAAEDRPGPRPELAGQRREPPAPRGPLAAASARARRRRPRARRRRLRRPRERLDHVSDALARHQPPHACTDAVRPRSVRAAPSGVNRSGRRRRARPQIRRRQSDARPARTPRRSRSR